MKSYVIVGLGSRSTMFIKAITEEFRESTELLAICDRNDGRINLAKNNLKEMFPDLKAYKDDLFEDMLRNEKPDYVIVCTKDSEHDRYICKSLEFGCDVITEKPMTTDENDANIPFVENASRVCNGKVIKADQPLQIGAPE